MFGKLSTTFICAHRADRRSGLCGRSRIVRIGASSPSSTPVPIFPLPISRTRCSDRCLPDHPRRLMGPTSSSFESRKIERCTLWQGSRPSLHSIASKFLGFPEAESCPHRRRSRRFIPRHGRKPATACDVEVRCQASPVFTLDPRDNILTYRKPIFEPKFREDCVERVISASPDEPTTSRSVAKHLADSRQDTCTNQVTMTTIDLCQIVDIEKCDYQILPPSCTSDTVNVLLKKVTPPLCTNHVNQIASDLIAIPYACPSPAVRHDL